jgi:hypothetical protein
MPSIKSLVERALPAMGIAVVVSNAAEVRVHSFLRHNLETTEGKSFPAWRGSRVRAAMPRGRRRGIYTIHQRFAIELDKKFRAAIVEELSDLHCPDDVQFRVRAEQAGEWCRSGNSSMQPAILRGHVDDKDVWIRGAATSADLWNPVGSQQEFNEAIA